MSSTKINTSTNQLSLELHQHQNLPRKCVRAIVKWSERKRILVSMITRSSKRLWVRLKRNKPWMHVTKNIRIHVTITLVVMNVEKTSATQCTNKRAKQCILLSKYPWVLWKSFPSIKWTLKTCEIKLCNLKYWKNCYKYYRW